MKEPSPKTFMNTPAVRDAIMKLLVAVEDSVEVSGGKMKHFVFAVHTTLGQASFTGGACDCKTCREAVATQSGRALGFMTAAVHVARGDSAEEIGRAVLDDLDADAIAATAAAAGRVN